MNFTHLKSKICIKCGFTKPIEDFILGNIDAKCGKKESDICKSCRKKDVTSWQPDKKPLEIEKKRFLKDLPKIQKKLAGFSKKKQGKVGLFQ
ncbi:MAG: hypothetical protein JW855_04945 [Gammaproteobacteria bacterium]|nr:hypothetical protein [Gammaproteobacteria bacterium]